jgi:Trypsin-like serine proteases, typically periplasmic, contain C-terminal PDZ domain
MYEHSRVVDPDPAEGVILQVNNKVKPKKKRKIEYSNKLTGDVILSKSKKKRAMRRRTKLIIAASVFYFIAMAVLAGYNLFYKKPDNKNIKQIKTVVGDTDSSKSNQLQSPNIPEANQPISSVPVPNTTAPSDTQTTPPVASSPEVQVAQKPAEKPAVATENKNPADSEATATAESKNVSIGITSYGEVTQENATQYNIPRGIMVLKVTPGSPAENAGLQYGDVIIKYNGTKVLYADDIRLLKEGGSTGDQAVLTMFRTEKGEFNVIIKLS